MASPMKEKGAKAEREVAAILNDLLGVSARRMLGAGRQDDIGDVSGVPDTTVQVVSYTDIARAIREKLPELETQQARAGSTFGALFVRRPGGRYVVVLSPEMWSTYWREAVPGPGEAA